MCPAEMFRYSRFSALHLLQMMSGYRQERLALYLCFFVLGLSFAAWGVHVPIVKHRFALSDARLSMALLAVALGSLGALWAWGSRVDRLSPRTAATLCATLLLASVAALGVAPSFALVLGLLLVFGAAGASLDVAINAAASRVETRSARPLMSRLHGMFSAGGIVGAGGGGLMLAHGLSPAAQMSGTALVGLSLIGIAFGAFRGTPGASPEAGSPADKAETHAPTETARPAACVSAPPSAYPGRHITILGIVALVTQLAEGAMYDWSTVYMRDEIGAGAAAVGGAYAAFSSGMALARFGGDMIRARLGAATLVLGCGVLAATGMSLALCWPSTAATLIGFGAMGLGLANMMPVLLAAAGQAGGAFPARAITRVAGLAYFGMMLGPPVIGSTAHLLGLSHALWLVAAIALLLGLGGAHLLRRPRQPAPGSDG